MRCESCKRDFPDDFKLCPYCGAILRNNEAPDEWEYAAFISYRHLPRDQEIAKRVQRAIESFRMPRGINAWGRSDQKIGKCFRDEDELAAASSLPDRIVNALEKSGSLIVVCTPDTKDSIWVQREVETYIKLHGRERVFAVLADGNTAESIPKFLKTEKPSISGTETVKSNPLAADMRIESSRKAQEETLRIIAAVAGCGFDDLRQRDKARRRKRLLAIAGAVVAVLTLLILAITIAIQSNREAQINESYKLAKESAALLDHGDRYGAIEKALEALPNSDSPFARPYVEDARQALVDALEIELYDQLLWRPSYLIELENDVHSLITEPDANWFAVLDSSINVSTFDYASGKKLASFSPKSLINDKSYDDNDSMPQCWSIESAGDLIIAYECAGSGLIAAYNAKTGQLEWEYSPYQIRALTTCRDGGILEFFTLGKNALISVAASSSDFKPGNWKMLENTFELQPLQSFLPITSDDNGLMFVGVANRVYGFDLSSDDPPTVTSEAKDMDVYSICQTQNSVVIASTSQIDTNAKSWNDYKREFRFEGLDKELNTQWQYSNSWMPRFEGEGRGLHAATGDPKVCGAAYMDREYIICTVGDSLYLIDSQNGELAYSEQFGSTIVFAGKDGLSESDYGDTVVVACADGTVSFRQPFMNMGENAYTLSFSFPSYILQSSVKWTSNKRFLAVAVSQEKPNQIYGYHLDTKGVLSVNSKSNSSRSAPTRIRDIRYLDLEAEQNDKPVTSYSLEELISLAHTTLSEGGRE